MRNDKNSNFYFPYKVDRLHVAKDLKILLKKYTKLLTHPDSYRVIFCLGKKFSSEKGLIKYMFCRKFEFRKKNIYCSSLK